MTFEELGLSPELLKAIVPLGFKEPTPVQAQVIPRLLANQGDMVALAQTGTGKTAAFGLPILNMLDHGKRAPQALILCPTRELCMQITRDLQAFAACSPTIHVVAVYGGAPIQTQLRTLERGVQIIVATPGRMLDILRRRKANLAGVERIILDEADEMLNMGFQEDLEAILEQVPKTAHTLLFSATMPHHVAAIARKHMTNAEEITVGHRNAGAETVTHECYVVHQRDRYRALKRIADLYPDMYGIVFCRTRQDTQSVADWLIRDGYNVEALHGDLSQVQRDRVMDKFRKKTFQLLVATDVAARGLDVTDLTHVINYNLPDELGNYTHRSGRTGRAGKRGISVVIVNMREKGKVQRIESMIRTKFEYRDVPSGREICEAQLFSLIERMKSVEVDHSQIDQYLPEIYESLKGMKWEEVVKRFVALEFQHLLRYYRDEADLLAADHRPPPTSRSTRSTERSSERSAARPPERSSGPASRDAAPRNRDEHRPAPDYVRLFINQGASDGLSPQKLTSLISKEGGHNVPVGRIDIMKKFSFFEIPKSDADAILLALDAADFQGRAVRVEPVDDDKAAKIGDQTRHHKQARRSGGGKSSKPHRAAKTGTPGFHPKRKPGARSQTGGRPGPARSGRS